MRYHTAIALTRLARLHSRSGADLERLFVTLLNTCIHAKCRKALHEGNNMQTSRTSTERFTTRAFTVALVLSMFSIGYNLIEGAVATYIGAQDETLALFGFGVDSFKECGCAC